LLFDVCKIGHFQTEARGIFECRSTVNKKMGSEGWLESGDRKKVQSATGFIVFSYKEAEDDRSYGDNHKTCKGGNTIRVP
jgi:hypothetical protein